MNKKYILIISISLVIILFVAGFILFNKIKKSRAEDRLYNELNTVVKDYYKDYYYNTLGNNDEVRKINAEKFRYTGIKINLEDLSKYKSNNNEILDKFKNSQTNSNCDYNKTTIVIYPIDPYGKEDIRIDSNIVCGL